MKVVGARRPGGPDVLEIIERATPHAGEGEVRVRVHAAAVSPADTLLRSGLATGGFTEMVPGLEAAGVVDEIGPGVETGLDFGLAVGDRVMALLNPTRPAGGAYAEWIVLPAAHVAHAPAGSSHAEASTLPLSGLTARLALDELALPRGAVVAVTGAAGAVGGHAVQLAKADGLTVVADAALADEDLVRSLGADHVVRRGPDVAEAIRRVMPGGVDAVVDAALIGGGIVPAVRDGGAIALLRAPDEAGSDGAVPAARDMTFHQVFVHHYEGRPEYLEQLRAAAEAGALTLRVARVYGIDEAADAHRALEAGGVRGRIVLRFPGDSRSQAERVDHAGGASTREWRRLAVPGAELAWTSDGDGPVAIWAHGLSSSSFGMDAAGLYDWSPVVAVGRRLVRFDARGHGRSSGRPDPGDYAFDRFADDLLALVDTVSPGAPVAGIGSSLGTATLLHAAVRQPDRFERLGLTAPPTAWETRPAQAALYLGGADHVEARGLAAFEELTARVAAPEIFRSLPGYPPELEVPEELLPALPRGVGASDLPAPQRLATLTLPVLVLAWAGDPGHPVSSAERLGELMPDARVEIAHTVAAMATWGATAARFLGRPRD